MTVNRLGSRGHLTAPERAARGLAAREACPPAEQEQFGPRPDRLTPATLLRAQAESRLPELVPVRHGRMLANPFAFYRGAAALMALDLAPAPVSGLGVQLCGDAHLSNFGLFASPERRLMFDLNDFDETMHGPWEWDVKRLAASLVVAGRQNGFDRKARRKTVKATVRRYRDAMAGFAGMRALDVWYARAEVGELETLLRVKLPKQRAKAVRRTVSKARTSDSLKAFAKLTSVVDGQVRINPDPPLVVPVADLLPGVEREQLEAQIRELLGRYRLTLQSDRRVLLDAFEFVDMARKVVGVGSVGTRCWIVLLRGRDDHDPLFLQVKEAQPSVLEPFVPQELRPAERVSNEGQRVVAGQRLMQATSDIFLGWQRSTGIDGVQRDFYVRQLRDQKGSAVVEEMVPRGMRLYGELCGWTLARAHARSGDPIAIAAYLGDDDAFPRAVAEFGERYADQNERDHAALTEAVAEGRLEAVPGV
ncbi:MAG TPA: DUF2252 domain-containing protein [Nocardioidaceae bacterium]|nr:DUF2252 domain-containing protein [Nocardioidaceae bacterium]